MSNERAHFIVEYTSHGRRKEPVPSRVTREVCEQVHVTYNIYVWPSYITDARSGCAVLSCGVNAFHLLVDRCETLGSASWQRAPLPFGTAVCRGRGESLAAA